MDAAAVLFVVKVPQDRHGLGETSIFLDGSGEVVLAGGALQSGDEEFAGSWP